MTMTRTARMRWWTVACVGLTLALLCRGYDKYTLEGRFFKHRLLEPVL